MSPRAGVGLIFSPGHMAQTSPGCREIITVYADVLQYISIYWDIKAL